MLDVLLIVVGLVMLFVGGEALIKGAVALARSFGLSRLLVSAVVVGFGTSMPELTVSVGAALKGSSDIAVGNVVGSNIANILLIVGVAAVLCPVLVAGKAVKRDALVMLASGLVLCGLAIIGSIGALSGSLMLLALVVYIGWAYLRDKKSGEETAHHIEEDIEGEPPLSNLRSVVYSLLGLLFLVGGAYFLVEGAVSIARSFNVPEAVIGLTIVAVGTSLPELATSVVASFHKHSDVVIGNILGSNIFNILSILGITAMVSPISIAKQIAVYDVWIMLAASAVLSVYLFRSIAIKKLSGFAMLMAYIAYTVWLYSNGSI